MPSVADQELSRQYQEVFGASPEEVIGPEYNRATRPEHWSRVNIYTFQRLGAESVQQVVLFSGYEHTFNKEDSLLSATQQLAKYVLDTTRRDTLQVRIEGSPKKPVGPDEDVFSGFGELGLLESKLRQAGMQEPALRWIEPTKEDVQTFAKMHGLIETLWYLTLRELPQQIDGGWQFPYAATLLYLLHGRKADMLDMSSVFPESYDSLRMRADWNNRYPKMLQLHPGRPSPEVVAALRRETTLMPALAVPAEERSVLQNTTILFNMMRQLTFQEEVCHEIEAGNDVLFAAGRPHHIAMAKKVEREFARLHIPYTRERWPLLYPSNFS